MSYFETQSHHFADDLVFFFFFFSSYSLEYNEGGSKLSKYFIFTDMKVNTAVLMSIMQLEKIAKLSKMEMSTRLHQDINEFYDNIYDALLDDHTIALYIKSLFEIPVTGINRCLQ